MSEPMVEAATPRRRAALFFPLAVFALLVALFFVRLYAGDSSRLPSALIGKQVPTFVLPPLSGLQDVPGLSNEDLRQGHVSVLNVFASWCAPCHQEHSTLLALAQNETLKAKGVRIAGLAYKDDQANSLKFLRQDGNPFAQVGVDQAGRVAIDFGVYGVPETFIIRGDGVVAYKFVGPLTPESLQTVLIPEIEKAMQ